MPRRELQTARGGPRSSNWNQQNDGRSNGYYDMDEPRERENRKTDNRRRVSFKASGAGPSRINRGWSNEIRSRLGEDDVMSGLAMDSIAERGDERDGVSRDGPSTLQTARRGKGRFRRRGSPIPKGALGVGKKKLISGSGWFIVTIPHGHKYERQALMRQLLTVVQPHVFIPHFFKVELTSIVFYVDDQQVAELLLNADRTLTLPDGHKMLIRVRPGVPAITVDDGLKEKMKLAMVKRYTAATKALDLTKFHADDDLRDIFCPLFRHQIMLAAVDVIAENIPELEALKLDDNKITTLEHLKCLPLKLPYLKILHLADNKIANTSVLQAIHECALVDLVLDGNPAKTHARDKSAYVSDLRKMFPKLVRLDNAELPPKIGFDVNDECQLPAAKASFLCNMAGAEMVRQFLEQYFIIFDSENRQPLLDAYHEQAMFSMTCSFSHQQHLRLSSYTPHNRNILRVKGSEDRNKLLHNGRLPVVAFLSQLPETQHDPLLFAVDLTLFTPQLIMLTVTGVFKEKSKSTTNLRSFQKVLTIVPSGSGFCIKNEMLHISNITIAQVKTAFKAPTFPAPVAAPVAVPGTSAAVVPDEATKQRMIALMSQHSNMNIEWSRKCLEETNWDFDRAGYTFTELHKQNKIPPEAFVK